MVVEMEMTVVKMEIVVESEDIPELEENMKGHMMKCTTNYRITLHHHHHPIHPCKSIIQAIRASGQILMMLVMQGIGGVVQVRALLKFLSNHLDM